MKTLREIEKEVEALGKRIGASVQDLPTYGQSCDGARPHIEVSNNLYHYVVVERGQELERSSSSKYEDLLYWIFADVSHNLAFSYELRNRIEDQDCRRIAFPKQVELMKQISSELGARIEAHIAEVLSRSPYDDEPTKSVNRMQKSNAS